MASSLLTNLDRSRIWLERLSDSKRLIVAFLAGCLGALAFPPVNLVFVIWISFPVLLMLIQPGLSTKMLFGLGWIFAFGFFLVGLYWVGISATVDLATFWWFVPIASTGLPAILACFVAPIPWIIVKVSRQPKEKVVLFIGLWLLHEWLRSWMFNGFPWNLVGYASSVNLAMTQLASVGGVWLLSLLILISASLPFLWWSNISRKSAGYLLLSLAIPLAMWGYGTLRLGQPTSFVQGIGLNLVQANIPQSLKWDPKAAETNFKKHFELSAFKPSTSDTELTIWSESAVPYLIGEDPNLRTYFADSIPEGNLLITGGNRRDIDTEGVRQYFNSLFVLDDEGKTVGLYDKKHLVPFGEYVPLGSLLPIKKLTAGLIDFQSGSAERRVTHDPIPAFVPLICYEIIFPGRIIPKSQPRPSWLLNITNDAWFGKSSGPYQHFAISRMRAIEEGLPLVRVSNPGITAIVDPFGRMVSSTNHDEDAVVRGSLPKALTHPPIFASLGNRVITLYLLMILLAFVLIRLCGLKQK